MNHPRDTYGYEGEPGPEAAFLDALERGRLHHAWLLTGPEGVGKATFAYRATRRLLGAQPNAAYGLLGASPDDSVSRRVAAHSHGDLLVLERDLGDGKTRRNITVDEARQLPEFFAKAPASAPYRVAIIDAADDLNVNAANAVLKTLEEPPERGVLFLISHSPGRLLPTIRSRCRRLAFAPWPEDRVEAFLETQGVSAHDAGLLAAMARGAPGRAMKLAQDGAIELDKAAHDILRTLPEQDQGALLGLAESFRGGQGARRFELLFERMADQIHAMSRRNAMAGETGGLDAWGQVWERMIAMPREVEGLNLDRADAFWSVMAQLRDAARA